ncbi:MAG: hypothetical protein P4L33_14085 [Capsulimonadaceae bacterium]|nr:hypothetical protein [Capsulimonadaceae bacterium]
MFLFPLGGGAGRCGAPASGAIIDFETLSADGLCTGPGKNSTAAASVSNEAAHGGSKAGKLAYTFTGAGYVEFQLKDPVVISQTSDKLDVSVWVKGCGRQDFGDVALRFQDATGNIFQYPAPGLVDVFDGGGWARYHVTLDPLKFQVTWGPSKERGLNPPIRFFGFGADHFEALPASGIVFVDDIAVQPAAAASESMPVITLSADRDPLVISPGASVTFKAAFSGDGIDMHVPVHYRWTMRDFEGKVLRQTPIATVLDGSPSTPLSVRPVEPGYISVTCEIMDSAGGVKESARSSLAVLSSIGLRDSKRPPFMIGANTHLLRWKLAETLRQIQLIRQCGFDMVRDGPAWGFLEPSEGDWRWESMDRLTDALKANHVGLLFGLAYTAKWATTGDQNSQDWHAWHNAPPITDKFVDYAKAVVAHYRSYVHDWEIWNEPDVGFWLGTSDQYAQLLSAAVKGIHEVDPTAHVLNGGVSEVYTYRPGFVADFIAKTSPKPDIWAYHSHGPLSNLRIARERSVAALTGAGVSSLPTWNDEAGIATVGPVSLRRQAIVLAEKIATSAALGDKAYFLYDLADDGTDPTDMEHHYGIVFHDLSPKPAFVAIHTVINNVDGKSFYGKLKSEADQTLYCYRNRSQTAVMLWTATSGASTEVLLRSSAPTATLTDLMGRTTKLKPQYGLYSVPISDEPRFVTFTGNAVPEAVASILRAPSATIADGAPYQYEVTLRNPLAKSVTGTLTANADGLTVQPRSTTVTLGSKETKSVRLMLRIADAARHSYAAHFRFQTTGALPPIDRLLDLPKALRAPWLPDGVNIEATAPMATLSGGANLVSLFAATPMTALHFHGPSDLSARCWLAHVEQGIRLHIAVTDDVHFPVPLEKGLWNGDSLQVALSGPSGAFLEWTVALTNEGPRVVRSVWPPEFSKLPLDEQIHVVREGTTTTYDLILPTSNSEIERAIRYGCKMSFLVNDNDGGGRKGWLEWTPGIGQAKDSTYFVPVAFR